MLGLSGRGGDGLSWCGGFFKSVEGGVRFLLINPYRVGCASLGGVAASLPI